MAKISIEEEDDDSIELSEDEHIIITPESSDQAPKSGNNIKEPKEVDHGQAPNNKGVIGKLRRFWYYLLIYWIHGPIKSVMQIISPHNKLSVIPKRKFEVAVITGGARGIGLEITKNLLIADMHVIVGCRDIIIGEKAISSMRTDREIATGIAECISLDLESFESVRNFATIILNRKLSINILINNAGIMLAPYKLTKDRLESHLQVNYLSHFLLTYLLLPALVKGGQMGRNSRVINVSSVQDFGKIDFEDFLMQKFYSPAEAYCNSKLMQLASTNYLDEQFQLGHLPVRCHAVHPGLVGTSLHKNANGYLVLKWIIKIFAQSPEKGADAVLYAAFSNDLENKGGTFTGNCKEVKFNPQALNKSIQERLWNLSCDLTRLDKLNIKKGSGDFDGRESRGSEALTQVDIG